LLSLWRLWRQPVARWLIVAAGFILLNVAALVRVLLVEVWPALSLWLAMLCWAAALLIYLGLYAPMLCRPRVDGHPG